MKKLLSLIVSFWIISNASAQTLRASLGVGSTSSRVKIYLKSDIALNPANISTLQFNLAIPASVDPKPTATVVSNFLSIAWTVENATESGFYHYMIQTAVSPLNPVLPTDEFEAMEVEFSASPLNINDVALMTLPDGGSGATNGKALFLATGTNINSNGSSLYYNRAGVVATNGFSYDLVGGTPGTTISTVVFSTLPVKFLSFYALKSGDAAKLTWTVSNDEENRYFDIERSADGRTYSSLTRVNAMGNGKSTNTYEATDATMNTLGAKDVYYRIKQVDMSGGYVYSVIRILNIGKITLSLGLYPNPARSVTKLVFDSPVPGKAAIVLRDAAGKQVQLINMAMVKGINQKDLNVAALPAGDYNVTLVSESLTQTIKLSKQN